MARSLRPSALRRNISLTQRIGTLSAGIGSPSLAGRGSLCGSTSDRAPPPPRGGADFKSESVADLDRNEWPTSNRNQWPASNRNGWPTSVGIRILELVGAMVSVRPRGIPAVTEAMKRAGAEIL